MRNIPFVIMKEADSGHSGEGVEEAQAGGEEDEAGGGVAQLTLQHFLQDGLDKR